MIWKVVLSGFIILAACIFTLAIISDAIPKQFVANGSVKAWI